MRIDPKELRRARRIATGAAALALSLGVLVLIGWMSDDAMLKTGLTGSVSMKANAAVGLCMASLAVLLRLPESERRSFRRLASGLGTATAILGGLTLSEHLFSWDLGIDQLLFTEPAGELATMSPGRMGPPASTCFLLLGLALVLYDRQTADGRSPSQWLSLPCIAAGTLGVLGYLTGATQLYGIARYTGISLPMAVALVALGVATFLARPFLRPASILVADNAGGQLARTMLPAAILVPIGAGWLRTMGQKLGFYDTSFGRALLLLSLIVIFATIVFRVAVRLSGVATARAVAERATSTARAEAERLALENVRTVSVLDALLAHAPLGLVFFDRERRCVRINDFLTRMQSAAGARVGASVFDILPGGGAALEAAIERVFEGESTADLELVGPSREDEPAERTWLTGIFPVGNGRGEIALAGAFVIEITERRRLEAQRAALLDSERAARSEAERAAHLKDQFLATVSHELRTPLNAILGWATVAQRSAELPSAIARPIDIIVRNARAQAQLIDDLLDVARIVSGKLKLSLERVELAGVVEAAALALRPAAEAKRIRLHSQVAAALPPVAVDPARLQQIVANLLSNAIKFTPSGGEITLCAREVEGAVEVRVSDQGAGIEPEFLPHVFDPFRQADASSTRRHGGLGLGLAIVKQLTELHGGNVGVHSEGPGKGSTFTISLPLDAAQSSGEATVESAPRVSLPDGALAGLRVLIVDDEADAREFLGRVFADHGAITDLAGSADDALAAVARRAPDLLVSDIGMPHKDGYALIAAVRAQHGPDVLPAIAVTAFVRPEDRARVASAGFQLHVGKPVDPYELALAAATLTLRARAAREPSGVLAASSVGEPAAAD